MAQDELSALEQIALLAMFHQNQQFQRTVRDHQRLARDAVIGAVLDSSDRFEMKLSLKLRQAQLNNESTMQHRDRVNFFRLGNEVQETIWGTSNVNSLKREKLKSISFDINWNHSNEHPQGFSNQFHKNVTMFVRNHKIAATAITDRNKLHISPGPKFKILHVNQMKIEKSEYFHDIHGRNLAERHRRVVEREMSHVRKDEPFFKNMKKKRKARPDRRKLSTPNWKRKTLKASSKILLLDKVPANKYHPAVMRPCQFHGQTLRLFLCFLTFGETRCQMRRGSPMPDDGHFGTDVLLKKTPLNNSDAIQQQMDITPTRAIMGSTHPRQATDWLARIDQAKSKQDLDDVGSVFGSTRIPSARAHEDHHC